MNFISPKRQAAQYNLQGRNVTTSTVHSELDPLYYNLPKSQLNRLPLFTLNLTHCITIFLNLS